MCAKKMIVDGEKKLNDRKQHFTTTSAFAATTTSSTSRRSVKVRRLRTTIDLDYPFSTRGKKWARTACTHR